MLLLLLLLLSIRHHLLRPAMLHIGSCATRSNVGHSTQRFPKRRRPVWTARCLP